MRISKRRQAEIEMNKELAKLLYQEMYMEDLSHDEQIIMQEVKKQQCLNQSKLLTQNV